MGHHTLHVHGWKRGIQGAQCGWGLSCSTLSTAHRDGSVAPEARLPAIGRMAANGRCDVVTPDDAPAGAYGSALTIAFPVSLAGVRPDAWPLKQAKSGGDMVRRISGEPASR